MEDIIFVHAADFHLDAPFRGGRAGYGSLRRQDVRRSFEAMVDLTLSEEADLLLICGDLFEEESVTRDTLSFVLRELDRLRDVQVLLLPGNHDPLTAQSWYHVIQWPENVHLLAPDRNKGGWPAIVELPELRVSVAGFGFSAVRQDAPDLNCLPAAKPNWYNLLLIHGSPDVPETATAYNPVQTAGLRRTGYDYVAMGHYHRPDIAEGHPVIAMPGSPEPMGFDETGPHGVLLGSFKQGERGTEAQVRQVPLAVRTFVDRELDVTMTLDADQMKMALAGCLQDCSPERHLPRVRLVGAPMEPPDVAALSDWFDDSWLLFRLVDETRPPLDWVEGLTPDSLSGVFVRNLKRRIEAAENAGDTVLAAKLYGARQMGLEALAYGRVHMAPERG